MRKRFAAVLSTPWMTLDRHLGRQSANFRSMHMCIFNVSYRRIHADVIVYIFAHLHTEGNLLDMN